MYTGELDRPDGAISGRSLQRAHSSSSGNQSLVNSSHGSRALPAAASSAQHLRTSANQNRNNQDPRIVAELMLDGLEGMRSEMRNIRCNNPEPPDFYDSEEEDAFDRVFPLESVAELNALESRIENEEGFKNKLVVIFKYPC